MSYKNHVPKRDCDFILKKEYALDDWSDFYYTEVHTWVKEEVIMMKQGRVGDEPRSISVNGGSLACPYHISLKKWESSIAETILLGD